MKLYALFMFVVAAGCGQIPAGEEATSESSAGLFPGQEFIRTIPPAPVSAGRRPWTPGSPLIPARYTPQSFYYFYAGDLTNSTNIAAIGFDVVAQQVMFEYDVSTRDWPGFATLVNDMMILQSLQLRDAGGTGNVTPKCCINPGDEFSQQAWGTMYLLHEAHAVTFQ